MPVTYNRITSTTLGSGQSSVSFTGITQSYTDLVFHCYTSTANVPRALNFTINGAGANQYSRVGYFGDGSSPQPYSNDNLPYCLAGTGNTYPVAAMIHFNNYSGTTSKQILVFSSGADLEGVGWATYRWKSTSAITDIVFTANNGGNILAGSIFTLYGILRN